MRPFGRLRALAAHHDGQPLACTKWNRADIATCRDVGSVRVMQMSPRHTSTKLDWYAVPLTRRMTSRRFGAGSYRPGDEAKPRAVLAAHAVVDSKPQLACEPVYALEALRSRQGDLRQ